MNANNINNPNDDSIFSDFNSGNEEELIEEEENEEKILKLIWKIKYIVPQYITLIMYIIILHQKIY